nr:unnamed protein product [Spirometra erinaceieuropaei]
MTCIIRQSMILLTATIALILLNVHFCSCSGFVLAVKQHTNIDLAYEVPASSRFNSSESGFVHGTARHPCEPSTKCVEFYPRRRSFLINDGTYENYSAVILTPENPEKAKIAIVVVNSRDFFPEIRGVHYIKPIVAQPGYARPLAVVMDENIKEIRLLGNISRYGSSSSTKGLKIIIPYEQVDVGFRLHVKPHTDIDLAYEVPASFRFNSSESGFAHRTPTHPCEPPTKCVEFYSRRRSFLINHGTYESYSALILTPENPQKAKIAIVVVNKTDFFPEIRGVHYIIPIVAQRGHARPLAVVMDENIKEIRLLGNISRYGSSSSRKGLKIIIPFGKLRSTLRCSRFDGDD